MRVCARSVVKFRALLSNDDRTSECLVGFRSPALGHRGNHHVVGMVSSRPAISLTPAAGRRYSVAVCSSLPYGSPVHWCGCKRRVAWLSRRALSSLLRNTVHQTHTGPSRSAQVEKFTPIRVLWVVVLGFPTRTVRAGSWPSKKPDPPWGKCKTAALCSTLGAEIF